MLNRVRRWHWNLLHRVFGLPDRDHQKPYAPSHPPVAVHHAHPIQQPAQQSAQNLHTQLERELQREPKVLKRWQHFIGSLFIHEKQ
jgi:hypothetical protein